MYRGTDMIRTALPACCAALVGVLALSPASSLKASPQRQVNQVAAAQAEFLKRVDDYMQLHKKIEATLPKLPDNATPQQIDQNQRALGDLIARARPNAKPGDLFIPAMQRAVHQLFADIFKGKAGQD